MIGSGVERRGGTDLGAIRKTALLGAALVVGYHIAGVVFHADQSPSGVTFSFHRPSLIPFGIQLFALFAAWRYWLHGVALSETPARARAVVAETSSEAEMEIEREVRQDAGKRERYEQALSDLKVSGSGTIRLCHTRDKDDVGASLGAWKARVARAYPALSGFRRYWQLLPTTHATLIDKRSEKFRGLLDLDYWAPVWANGIALALSIASLVI